MKDSPLKSPRIFLALIVAVAIVVAALLVVLSQLGGKGASVSEAGSSAGGSSGGDIGKLYSGIPQNGTTLGKSDAPVTIYLYEDFQCPFCGQFSRDTFPKLVNDYVRSGKVKMVSEPLAFLGPDSKTAARAALAASKQNHYWPYYSLLFENQGEENSGYVTGDFLKGLAQKTPGLDVNKWDGQRTGSSFDSELNAAQSKAGSEKVNSTPTLIVSGSKGKKKLAGLRDYDQISSAIQQVHGS